MRIFFAFFLYQLAIAEIPLLSEAEVELLINEDFSNHADYLRAALSEAFADARAERDWLAGKRRMAADLSDQVCGSPTWEVFLQISNPTLIEQFNQTLMGALSLSDLLAVWSEEEVCRVASAVRDRLGRRLESLNTGIQNLRAAPLLRLLELDPLAQRECPQTGKLVHDTVFATVMEVLFGKDRISDLVEAEAYLRSVFENLETQAYGFAFRSYWNRVLMHSGRGLAESLMTSMKP